jgi:GNAT superfamily N-acetyltransferase
MISILPPSAVQIEEIARWLADLPLLQRYGLEPAAAAKSIQEAQRRGDWLLTAIDEDSGSAIGFAWVMPEGAFGRSAYLRLIALHPGYTGRGLGAKLLAHAEQLALELRHDLFLLVSDFNTRAQQFYERQGYDRVGALRGYVLPDVDELVYWKRLTRK